MKKIIYFLILITITSCSPVLKQQDLCGGFIIATDNKKYNVALNFVKLKEDLTKKLELIKSKSSKNICQIKINTVNEVYDSFSDSDGISSRQNIRTNINIKMFVNNELIFEDKNSLFYYDNTLSHRYSDYSNNLKTDVTNNVAEDLLLIIKTNIDRMNK